MLGVSAAALGSQARGWRGWGRWAGRGPALAGGWDPCPLPTPIYFRCLCCFGQHTPGCCATRPRQPPAPLTASSCIFDKVIGIFLLTGFSLHFTCSFPRAHSTGSRALCLAWLPFPIAGPWQDSHFLFILSFDSPVVEGKADVRRGRGGMRRGALGLGGQGEGGEHVRDENDLLAPGSPTLAPSPSPKAQHAPRPPATPSAACSYHTDSALTLLYVCLPSTHLPHPCLPGPPACVCVHFYLNKLVW